MEFKKYVIHFWLQYLKEKISANTELDLKFSFQLSKELTLRICHKNLIVDLESYVEEVF